MNRNLKGCSKVLFVLFCSMVETYREYVAERESNKNSNDSNLKVTPKTLFQYATEGLESLHEISLEIQEKYAKS